MQSVKILTNQTGVQVISKIVIMGNVWMKDQVKTKVTGSGKEFNIQTKFTDGNFITS